VEESNSLGFLVWLLILILEMVMQAINLVSVDLTRQWCSCLQEF